MSTVTGSSSTVPQAVAASLAAGPAGTPAVPSQLTTPSSTAGGNAAQPADVVSLSSNATTATAQTNPPLRSMDPMQVDDALSSVAGANGFAFIAAHWDYAGELARGGKAIADRNLAVVQAAAAGSAPRAVSMAQSLGIAVQVSATPATSQGTAATAPISVSAFSFTSGGSTYAVTPGANGTLIGTKDGQVWQTWQLTDPDLPGNVALAAAASTGTETVLSAAPQAAAASLATGSGDATTGLSQPTTPPSATRSNTAQPADVAGLSSTAATAAAQVSPSPRSMNPTQVDDALSWVSGANGFAFLYTHFDRAHAAAQFGDAVADRGEAELRGAAADSASFALSNASAIGIPVKDSVSRDAVKNGAAPGTITVGAFSFTSGGSTYAITPSTNGTLVGTKNGQAWTTWQLTDPDLLGNTAKAAGVNTGAETALQALIAANKQTLWPAKTLAGPVNILT